MSEASATTANKVSHDFIQRWESSGAAERANYVLFLTELCDLLGVARPEPTKPDDVDNAYVFERAVTFQNGDGTTSVGRIDLYKRGCFVLEAKQGSEQPVTEGLLALPKRPRRKGTAVRGTAGWDGAMLAAKGQAEHYVKGLPEAEPNPPFLAVVDVGHTIELYSDFTRQGRTFTPFPDALSHRIKLRELADESSRERLRLVWSDPLSLDPSRRSAKITCDVAARLAKLAQSLERSGQSPEAVAQFLMRCLFTFFAEDAGLISKEGFTSVLRTLRAKGNGPLSRDGSITLGDYEDGRILAHPEHSLASVQRRIIRESRGVAGQRGTDQSSHRSRGMDFHSLRRVYISNLVSSGASVKTCQVLARHSTPSLTIGIYTKASLHDIQGAVDSLPDLTPTAPAPEALAATGTDPATSARQILAAHGQCAGDRSGRILSDAGGNNETTPDAGGCRNTLELSVLDASGRTLAGVGRGGIEPATPGF